MLMRALSQMSSEGDGGGSDASDIFHVSVDPEKTWTTMQDREMEQIRALARPLRNQPLLLPAPLDATVARQDVQSGIKLPGAHCAFRGCCWVGDNEDEFREHLLMTHGKQTNNIVLMRRD